jgi:hypothetical protein
MATPEIRDRRRVLRFRNLLVRQAVRMKNKVSGLLMETGIDTTKGNCTRRSISLKWLWRLAIFAAFLQDTKGTI